MTFGQPCLCPGRPFSCSCVRIERGFEEFANMSLNGNTALSEFPDFCGGLSNNIPNTFGSFGSAQVNPAFVFGTPSMNNTFSFETPSTFGASLHTHSWLSGSDKEFSVPFKQMPQTHTAPIYPYMPYDPSSPGFSFYSPSSSQYSMSPEADPFTPQLFDGSSLSPNSTIPLPPLALPDVSPMTFQTSFADKPWFYFPDSTPQPPQSVHDFQSAGSLGDQGDHFTTFYANALGLDLFPLHDETPIPMGSPLGLSATLSALQGPVSLPIRTTRSSHSGTSKPLSKTSKSLICRASGSCGRLFPDQRTRVRHEEFVHGPRVYFCPNTAPSCTCAKDGYARGDSLGRRLRQYPEDHECVIAAKARGWAKDKRRSIRCLRRVPAYHAY